jgi:hypothetical protein
MSTYDDDNNNDHNSNGDSNGDSNDSIDDSIGDSNGCDSIDVSGVKGVGVVFSYDISACIVLSFTEFFQKTAEV